MITELAAKKTERGRREATRTERLAMSGSAIYGWFAICGGHSGGSHPEEEHTPTTQCDRRTAV